ncbi:MAG: tetratricopeptide repeat protein [Planctomycetaceae bacterium]
MSKNVRVQRERKLEAARGYLLLDMPQHALRELNGIDEPEKAALAINQLRGEALRVQGDFHEALLAYNRALAEDPNDLTVLLGMAWCYKRTNQLSRAIAAMEQAYRAKPDEPIVLYNLSCYFALDRNKTQALSWLGRALRMESSLRKLIPDEHDFDPLRDDPDFQFVAGLRNLSDAT